MKKSETNIEGAFVYILDRYYDNRGFFQEIYSVAKEYPDVQWDQGNLSVSKPNVVRGMHLSPYPKLITCVSGKIFDAIVDLRPDSPTYLTTFAVELDASFPIQFYIPAGCAHGFYAYERSVVVYLQGGVYDPNEPGYHWKSFGIPWPKKEEYVYVISDKDRNATVYKPERPLLDHKDHLGFDDTVVVS